MPTTRNTGVKAYFTFTKKERRAVMLLAVLALVFAFLPTLFPYLVKDEVDFFVDEEAEEQLAIMRTKEKKQTVQEDETNTEWYQPKTQTYQQKKFESKAVLFAFDPNTATEEELKRLGIKEKTVRTILNYRNKGGRFKKPEDFNRIYGLSAIDKERLLPFVKIESEVISTTSSGTTSSYNATQPVTIAGSSFSEKKSKPIDINTADTAAWRSLKGIGAFYAKRIVNFREKLGGFYSVHQVGETFGLPDSTFQSIKPFLQLNSLGIKQINLNTASVDDLKAHPYINGTLAKAIINYRTAHGFFKSVEQLRQLDAFDEVLYIKIAPYLTVKE